MTWRRAWISPIKRKRSTSFRVCCWLESRRRIVGSFPDETAARAFAGRLELFINGQGPEPDCDKSDQSDQSPAESWPAAVEAWVAGLPVRRSTAAGYRGLLLSFGRSTGLADPANTTEGLLGSFLDRLRASGRSSATTAAYLKALRRFYGDRGGVSPVTPALLARWKPYRRHKRQRPHYYPEAELDRIMAVCEHVAPGPAGYRTPGWWRAFITLLHDCGVRLSEAAHLIWRDVDFAEGVLRIQAHDRLPGVFPWRPKASGSNRTLAMTPRLAALLADLQARQAEGVPYVFLPAARYRELCERELPKSGEILAGILRGFVRIRRRAGIQEGTIHDLRRTCITNWARHPDLKPKDVQVLAGHEDIQTTLGIYTMVEEGDVLTKQRRIMKLSVPPATPLAAPLAAESHLRQQV